MPAPVVEPSPSFPAARFGAAEEAQEASYLAASARMRSFLARVSSIEQTMNERPQEARPTGVRPPSAMPHPERRQSPGSFPHGVLLRMPRQDNAFRIV